MINHSQNAPEKEFQQWHRFIQDHCYRWQGILSRYDQQGHLTDVLDSIRHFTVNQDATSINHTLNFIHRTNPEKSLIKTWDVTKCSPGITHPIDTKSRAFFTTYGSGMMSRPFNAGETNYVELYLNHAHYRTSIVIMYHSSKKDFHLAQISLFRETRMDDLERFWSVAQMEICNASYPSMNITKTIQFDPSSLVEMDIIFDELNLGESDRQIFCFPDGLTLNIPLQLTPSRVHHLTMGWVYTPGQVKQAIAQFPGTENMPILFTQFGEIPSK